MDPGGTGQSCKYGENRLWVVNVYIGMGDGVPAVL